MTVVDVDFGRPPEPYLSRVELAEMMGVSVKTVDRWVKGGMPSETWGLRTRRFLASQAVVWARANRRAG